MLSVYIKEQKRYYKNELIEKMQLKQDEVIPFIRRLKSFGVLKMVKATSEEKDFSDLLEEEVALVDNEEEYGDYFYVFTFVGILTIGNRVLKCYPKYIEQAEPLEKMKQILQVLRKYNAQEQIINLYNGNEENVSFNYLAIMLYIVEEYLQNGSYINGKRFVETNGMGEILWDDTINDTFALIKNNRPYYMELKTENTVNDEADYFRRLHLAVVTQCAKLLELSGLAELLNLEVVDVSDEELKDFGDNDYICYRLEQELDIQFVDRKKLLLKTLYAFVAQRKVRIDDLGISLFGTNNFNLVWEKACAEAFNNQLNRQVKDLPMKFDYFRSDTRDLIEIIEKPKWRYKNTDKLFEQKKTLTPDLISIYPCGEEYCFSILDAKYYAIKLTDQGVSGQPGVSDITKQYLYQLAYSKFIKEAKYEHVQNAFLFPGDGNEGEYLGQAEFNMLLAAGDDKQKHISAIRLPAQKVYERYLNGTNKEELYQILRKALYENVRGD